MNEERVPLDAPAPADAAPRKRPVRRRLLRLGGLGCLGLIALGLLCGGLAAFGYRAGIAEGAEAAATLAAEQVALSPSPASGLAPCEPPPAGPTGETGHTLRYGDLERRYVTYVPGSIDPGQPVPLIVSLHGAGSDAAQQRDISQWNVFAEAHGFIVVYPEAAEETNRTFVSFPAQNIAPQLSSSTALIDVIFIRDVLDAVQAAHCIDPARIYVNGFSAGGAMSLFLACRLPGTFAAIGTVAAPYWADLDDPAWCPPGPGRPTMTFHGTADRVIPYPGGGPPFGFDYVRYEEWTARWAARNGCADPPASFSLGNSVSGRRFDCPDGAEMVAYTVEGGGHAWPGGAPILDPVLGQTTKEIAATAELWAFFRRASSGPVGD